MVGGPRYPTVPVPLASGCRTPVTWAAGPGPSDNRAMNLRRTVLVSAFALGLAGLAVAQPCPKVTTTTQTPATMRALQKSINCLVDYSVAPSANPAALHSADVRSGSGSGTQVDTLPIIGPQHSRMYPGFVLAILSMPVDNAAKSAIVTSDSPQAAIRGAGGGECKLKLNADRTVDAVCNQAGGTVFVVYR